MNIELLIKFVKLANHNPNDNEANSAARRVCKMIEDSNFKFNDTKTNVNNKSTITWNDVIFDFGDLINREVHYRTPNNYRPSNPYYTYSEPKENRPKIKVKCKKCGLEIERPYSDKIDKDNYVCSICAWQEYLGVKL
jgi:hypothetical protein